MLPTNQEQYWSPTNHDDESTLTQARSHADTAHSFVRSFFTFAKENSTPVVAAPTYYSNELPVLLPAPQPVLLPVAIAPAVARSVARAATCAVAYAVTPAVAYTIRK